MIKQPSAFLPVTLSLLALALVLQHLVRFGPSPQPDEGAAAHIWQVLMAAQIPMIGYFAIRRLPQAPRGALLILAVQIGAGVAAAAPIFLLGW